MELFIDAGHFDKRFLDKKRVEVEESVAEAKKELAQVEAELEQLSNSEDRYKEAKKRLKNVRPLGEYIQERMEKIPFEDRRALIEAFLGPEDFIELHEGGDFPDINIKGLPPLIISWRSVLDIARLEEAAKQIKLGKSLKAAMGGGKKDMGIQDERGISCYLPEDF